MIGNLRSAVAKRPTTLEIMDAVDMTLACLPPRDLLSEAEVCDLLSRLDALLVGAEEVGTTGHSIIEGTLASVSGWPAVDRERIVDPLLDIRNLFVASRVEHEP